MSFPPYVCLKPDEYTNETTVPLLLSAANILQILQIHILEKLRKHFHVIHNVLFIIHYRSCWKCLPHRRVKIYFVACDTSVKCYWQKQWGLFTFSECERTVAPANSSFCSDEEKRKGEGVGSTQLEYRSHQNPILRDSRRRKQASLFASITKDDRKRLLREKIDLWPLLSCPDSTTK